MNANKTLREMTKHVYFNTHYTQSDTFPIRKKIKWIEVFLKLSTLSYLEIRFLHGHITVITVPLKLVDNIVVSEKYCKEDLD